MTTIPKDTFEWEDIKRVGEDPNILSKVDGRPV